MKLREEVYCSIEGGEKKYNTYYSNHSECCVMLVDNIHNLKTVVHNLEYRF